MMVTLRFSFVKGDEKRYRCLTTMIREANEKVRLIDKSVSTVDASMVSSVIEVQKDGKAHLVNRLYPSAASEASPRPEQPPEKQVIYLYMDSTGEIIEMSGVYVPSLLVLPPRPVSVGERWERESPISMPGMAQPIKVASIFTLEELLEIRKIPTAKIGFTTREASYDVSFPSPTGEILKARQSLQTYGEAYFAHRDGYLIKQTTTTHGTAKMGELVLDTSVTFTMEIC